MPVRKTTRAKKAEETPDTSLQESQITPAKSTKDPFTPLLDEINQAKFTYETLLKQIRGTSEAWQKEQQEHERQLIERNQQEEIGRKREQETYEYETKLARKKAEDDFTLRKAAWERELSENQEKLAAEKKELEELRKRVANFEEEKETAIKQAYLKVQKDLQEKFETEKKLREQEYKSEKELLTLKLTNLTQENAKLNQEIFSLKKMLDEMTKEFRNVAVKVIESNKPVLPPPPTPAPKSAEKI